MSEIPNQELILEELQKNTNISKECLDFIKEHDSRTSNTTKQIKDILTGDPPPDIVNEIKKEMIAESKSEKPKNILNEYHDFSIKRFSLIIIFTVLTIIPIMFLITREPKVIELYKDVLFIVLSGLLAVLGIQKVQENQKK